MHPRMPVRPPLSELPMRLLYRHVLEEARTVTMPAARRTAAFRGFRSDSKVPRPLVSMGPR